MVYVRWWLSCESGLETDSESYFENVQGGAPTIMAVCLLCNTCVHLTVICSDSRTAPQDLACILHTSCPVHHNMCIYIQVLKVWTHTSVVCDLFLGMYVIKTRCVTHIAYVWWFLFFITLGLTHPTLIKILTLSGVQMTLKMMWKLRNSTLCDVITYASQYVCIYMQPLCILHACIPS